MSRALYGRWGYPLLLLLGFYGMMADAKSVRPREPIFPIPLEEERGDPKKIELGQMLWFEKRLSLGGDISCNSCHNLAKGGADDRPFSIGYQGREGRVNSPTVYNARYNIAQFWDGRARTLQEQVEGPITDPNEMASTWTHVIETLEGIPQYKRLFDELYGEGEITKAKIADVISTFEETLTTPNSRFDQWLRGNDAALSRKEREGYELFKSAGCTTCHNGINVGGTSFQKIGRVNPFETKSDHRGREEFTNDEYDRNVFKVPTLRNIELTAPYFHDGQAKTLEEAIKIMGHVQLGIEFTPEEIEKMIAFLKTLTGRIPKIEPPELPR